jgi:xanthine dehydrogenase accessory factor
VKPDLLFQLNAERQARRPCVLVTNLTTGDARIVQSEALSTESLNGTVFGEALAEAIRSGKSGLVEIEGEKLFLKVQLPPVKLVAIGAVHISQALAPFAAQLGLAMTVIDPRDSFATPERFPNVPVISAWPDEHLPGMAIDQFTAFVALTHDPKIDDPALIHALRSDCFYIGALGSRKTHAKRVERLKSEGFSDVQLMRIKAPIGLDIGAVSPAEIALSIAGEIVAAMRTKRRSA